MLTHQTDDFFLTSGLHEELQNVISSHFNELEQEELRQFGLILLKPDSVASGKGPDIISFLKSHGIFVIDVAPIISPREAQFEELYKFNLTLKNAHNQIGSWWLNRQVYTAGPSLMLLVKNKQKPETDIFQKIKTIKGSSSPNRAVPGQIRHDFKGTNMALNLVHASDDPISMLREYLIFSDLQRLKDNVIRQMEVERLFDDIVTEESVLCRMNLFFDLFGARKVQTNVFCVCLQLMGELMMKGCGKSNRLGSIAQLISRNLKQLEIASFEESLTIVNNVGERILHEFSSNDNFEAMAETVEQLKSMNEWSDSVADTILKNLTTLGLVVSDWDKLIIQSSAHYASTFKTHS